jgi:putative zinc finger protein
MNCRRIEKLMPLYVEGDLENDQAARVSAHIEECGDCKKSLIEYEASQSWLRLHEPPEFEDALFDSIRLGVMSEINQKRHSAFARFFETRIAPYRAYYATACLLIIFAAFAFYFYPGSPNAVLNPKETTAESSTPVPAQNDVKQASEANPAEAPALERKRFRAAPAVKTKKYTDHANSPQPDNVIAQKSEKKIPNLTTDAGTNTEEMMRIEFQTSDPNIRIIWLSPVEAGSQLSTPLTETD